MLKKNQPGFFFQTFLTTDRIQHHLWRYCDQTDPTYPGSNEVEGGIDQFFALIDKIVGDFMDALDDDDILLLMSDHGHGMRCTHTFNFNEYLYQKGYLKSAGGGRKFSKKVLLEKLKNRVLKFLNDNDLEEYISKIAKLVPNASAMKSGKHISNNAESQAYASDFAGTNPFGGICINKDKVDDYEAFRTKLMAELDELTYEGKKMIRWMRPREALYNGKHIERYPDILYEMVPELGTGMSMHSGLFSINPTHKKISGGHKKNGIFFSNQGAALKIDQEECKITNIHTTLVSLFDLDGPDKTHNFIKSA
jgi:predicted AlkP superfamily phosphohydrolase/phosphomutase